MAKPHFISDKLRVALLFLLVCILFVNWNFYLDVYYALQDMNRSILESVSAILPAKLVNNEKLFGETIPKGISYVVLMLLNIGLSLTIIFVYFRDKKITLQGAKMIFIYFGIGFLAMNICYFAGMEEYARCARHALNN